MVYDIDLEARMDSLTGRLGEITKKRMFGGIGYMLGGNMAFGIHKESLILRTTAEKAEELLRNEYASPFDITGRPMKGWVMISPDGVETQEQLLEMLVLGCSFAQTLPKK